MSVYILIPLLPLIASLTLVLAGRRLGESAGKLATAAITVAFALSVGAFVQVLNDGPISIPLYRLLQAGDLVVDLSLYIDQLTVLLLLLVTGVSALVHSYSSRYMIGDAHYARFFAVTSLFTFAMVMVVTSGNLLVTFMFWEVMGICSYLLISHWAERAAATKAATKAFLVNAVADVGFALGLIVTLSVYGTLDIQQILAQVETFDGHTIDLLGWAGVHAPVHANTLIVLCLLMGAMGKSAQVPFHVWLPFAMEAPTPVSALIHAATMVNAGPFLLVRFSPLLVLAPTAMAVIFIVGATTALFAALVALTQPDIKKMLAYSTISHIGFMFMTCGVGAFAAAVFHLLAHGFLKGFLFLSTGNALTAIKPHAPRGTEPAPPSGARRPWSAAAGVLGLTLVPAFVIFSGPYEAMWSINGLPSATMAFWVLGLVTVFVTALYLLRGITSLFRDAPSLRDFGASPSVSITPRLASLPHVLAFAGAGVGLASLLLLLWSWFGGFLAPALGQPAPVAAQIGLGSDLLPRLLLPLGAAVGGLAVGYVLQARPTRTVAGWRKSMYVFFMNKLYFDEVYDACVVRPTVRAAGWLWNGIDRWIDRGPVRLAAWIVRGAGWLRSGIDRWIDRGPVWLAAGLVRGAGWLRSGIDRWIDRGPVWLVAGLVRGAGWLRREIDRWLDRGAVHVAAWLARQPSPVSGDASDSRPGVSDDALDRSHEAARRLTLQHQLLVVVGGLLLVMGTFFFLQA